MSAPEKSQREKMVAGELYVANDPQLHAEPLRAQALLTELDPTGADEDARRVDLPRPLPGHPGEGAMIEPTLRCDHGTNITVGGRTFPNSDGLLLEGNHIEISADVQFGPAVTGRGSGAVR